MVKDVEIGTIYSPPDPRRVPPHVPRRSPVAVSPAIAALAGAQQGQIAAFWQSVRERGAPLVETADDPAYRIVTFVWQHSRVHSDVQAVHLIVNCLTDRGDPSLATMDRLDGTDIWHKSFRLRSDWRASYQIAPQTVAGTKLQPGPQGHANAGPDPLNRRGMPSRRGEVSLVSLPDAPDQPWWNARDGRQRGVLQIQTFRSAILDNERPVWIYRPAGALDADLPVIVLLDGDVWAQALSIVPTLDNLIGEGRIPPCAALLPGSLDLETRWQEMAGSDAFLHCLGDELLPWAGQFVSISNDSARTIVGGESLGGLTALYACMRLPHRFGNALAQSSSLWWPAGGEFDDDSGELIREVASTDRRDVNIYIAAGLREGSVLALHRHLRDVLTAKAYNFTYREYNGGHDYACWRGGIAEGLIELTASWQRNA